MDGLILRERASFHVADYVIFGLTVAISLGVGVYFAISGGRQKTMAEYLVGNRNMKVGPVGLSLIVSFESSILLLGFPAEIYAYGTQFFLATFGQCASFVIVAFIFVPMVHDLKITSAYEYLDLRFKSHLVRQFGAFLGILNQTFYMGIVLFGPATALDGVVGFPVWCSIILVAAASVFYTSLGGFKAVIWTDVLQCTIMVGGMVAVIVMGCVSIGGFDYMWKLNQDGGRVKFFDFDPNPIVRNTFWTLIVGHTIRNVQVGFNQSTVQRVISMDSVAKAKIVVLMAVPGFFIFGILACLEGMVSYAYFAVTKCDPYGAKIISNPNQVLPYVVMELFRDLPGLPGLFLVALFSASLSTLSSALSSISAIVSTDIIRPYMGSKSETVNTLLAKIVVIVFGGISVGIAFVIMLIGGPLQQISYSLLGSITGPLTGMFIAGCCCPFTNSIGALTGGVLSWILSMWLSFGSSFSSYTRRTPYLPPAPTNNCFVDATFNYTVTLLAANATTLSETDIEELTGISKFYSISYHYFAAIGIFSCVVVAVVTSVLSGGLQAAHKVDNKHLVPLLSDLQSCFRRLCYSNRNSGYEMENICDPDNRKERAESAII